MTHARDGIEQPTGKARLGRWRFRGECLALGLLLPIPFPSPASPPQITSLQIGSNMAQIEFNAGASDAPGLFVLETASDVAGPYTADTGATISLLTAGKFCAVASAATAPRFYRIHRQAMLALQEDFSSQAIGAAPQGWTAIWDIGGQSWQVIQDGPHRRLEHTAFSEGYKTLTWDAAGQAADAEILARVLSTSATGTTQNRLVLRAQGGAGSENGYSLDLRNGQIRIWRWLNGSGVRLGEFVDIGWQTNAWYWMRFRAEGNQLKGKVWQDGEPEPSSWTIERQDSSVPGAGRIGIGNYSTGGSRWFDYIAVATGGGTALKTTDLHWFEDFAAQIPGQPPAGWTPIWVTTPGVWQVVERHGTRQLRHSVASSGYYALRWDAIGSVADVELLGLAQATSNSGGTQNRLLVRASGTAGSEAGYTLDLRDGTVRIFRFLNGAGVALGASINIAWQPDTWYWMRFRVEGNQLKGKVWPAGTSEPAGWTLERTDSNIPGPGAAGVSGWSEAGTRYFAYVAAGPNGVSPPVPFELWRESAALAFTPMRAQQPISAQGVFGFSAGSAFMAGQYNTVAHYDGAQWIAQFLSTPYSAAHFYAVWGSSPSNVWAVGSYGMQAHWNGETWTYAGQVSGGYLQTGIWGTSANNIWSVGSAGRCYRFNGASWNYQGQLPTDGETLRAIWGWSANAIYAVGDSGKIVTYNGSSWSAMTNASATRLNAIWGAAPDQLFAVGSSGVIRRFNGSTWSADPQSGTVTTKHLRGLWGFGADHIYAVGDDGVVLRYNGTDWSVVNAPTWTHNLQGAWADGERALFMVGNNGGTVQGARAVVNCGRDSYFRLVELANPDRTEVRQPNGDWIATLTRGSFTMTHRGPTRTFSEGSVSVQHDIWVQLLPEPFNGQVDIGWLNAALNDTSPDVLQTSMQYVAGAPPVFQGGIQVGGQSGYGDGIGSDFNDYLGITYVYSSGSTTSPEASRFQTMDCSGWMRMLFGYRGTPHRVPLGTGGIPRTSNDQLFYGHGTAIIPYSGTEPPPAVELAKLMPGDLVFFKSTSREPLIDHVGMYLGRDNNNRYRFTSSLGGTVGPRFGTALYVLDGNNFWANVFKGARRL